MNKRTVRSSLLCCAWVVASLALWSVSAVADTGFTPPGFVESSAAVPSGDGSVALSTMTQIGMIVLIVVVAAVAVFFLRKRIPTTSEPPSTPTPPSDPGEGDVSK